MSQRSHTRDDIRKELLPQFEELVDVVYEARLKESSMEAEESIAKAGDKLGAKAIGQWLLSFDRDDDFVTIDGKTYYRLGDLVEKSYSTKRGHVRLARHIYRPMGEHNGRDGMSARSRGGNGPGAVDPGLCRCHGVRCPGIARKKCSKSCCQTGSDGLFVFELSAASRRRG